MFYTLKQLLWSLLLASSIVVGIFALMDGSEFYKNVNMYMSIFLLDIAIFIRFVRNWKYISMPYAQNLYGRFLHNTILGLRDRRTVFLDLFLSKKNVKTNSILLNALYKIIGMQKFTLYYYNFIAIDKDQYEKNAEKMIHYLGYHQFSISVEPIFRKMVKLVFYKLPHYYRYFDVISFIKNPYGIFLGLGKDDLTYRDFAKLDHHLVVGESGAGKSNFMHVMLFSILKGESFKNVDKIYLIDLKGGIELKRYENINKMNFVYDIKELDELLNDIVDQMNKILKRLREKNIRKAQKFTFIFFDEIGAISSYPDKKLRESIFRKLALIAMQGRAAGILIFAFAQKIDSTILPSIIVNNLQSRVLFKTTSDHNINLVDLKENLREKFTIEVQDFPKGRCIYKYGDTSEKIMVQTPYIDDATLDTFINFFEKIYPKLCAPESA